MKAQVLYDLREELGFCSGTDLHEYFQDQLGDGSPSGYAEIDKNEAYEFAIDCAIAVAWNNNGNWEFAEEVADKFFLSTMNTVEGPPDNDFISSARQRLEEMKARWHIATV